MKIKLANLISKDEIFNSVSLSLSFSAFIYFAYFEFNFYLLNSIVGLFSIYGFLNFSRKSLIFAGFIIGLLWFYWIGFSFQYYEATYMVPLVIIGFGFVYALFFGVVSLSEKPYFRAVILFTLTFWSI